MFFLGSWVGAAITWAVHDTVVTKIEQSYLIRLRDVQAQNELLMGQLKAILATRVEASKAAGTLRGKNY